MSAFDKAVIKKFSREKGLYFREIADFYGFSPQAIHQRLN